MADCTALPEYHSDTTESCTMILQRDSATEPCRKQIQPHKHGAPGAPEWMQSWDVISWNHLQNHSPGSKKQRGKLLSRYVIFYSAL